MTKSADLLLERGIIVTMDPGRRVYGDGAIAVRHGEIVDVDTSASINERWQSAQRVDLRGNVALPGLVNAHVHLTGLDLFPGLEPADSPPADHLAHWALPSHVYATPDDERISARFLGLQMLKQGVTAFIEAATIRFPEAVLDGLADLRLRGAIGTWTWDRWDKPVEFRTSTAEAIDRMHAALLLAEPDARVTMWPTLIGHTSASDELWCAAAAAASERGTHWSFHMSPGRNDGEVFRAQMNEDPFIHLDRLGVMSERSVIAHAIHITDSELEVLNGSGGTVAFCPASNLAHASGLTRAAKHDQMAHVALGTDSPHRLPLLQAAGLTCSLFGDLRGDRTVIPPERALEMVTLAGARALGLQDRIGSLEVGKRADVAVFEVTRPVRNVANALVHHVVSGRAVHVFIDGEHVVCEGHVANEDDITSQAITNGEQLARRAGFPARTGWPLIE